MGNSEISTPPRPALDAAQDVMAVLHDLRAPLGGIDAMTALLSQTKLDVEQDKLVAALMAASRHLRSVADGVLGGDTSAKSAETLQDQLLAIARAAEARARTKGLQFHTRIAPNLPQAWTLSATTLRRLLENLIDNAVKATTAGTISFEVKTANGKIECIITDTGCGMTPAQQRRLIQTLTGKDTTGTGYGLDLIRLLAHEAKGSIRCQSSAGAGTAISVTLPCSNPDPKHSSPVALVIDDHPVNRQILSVILRHLGCEPIEAASGEEALKRMELGRVDVLFLDEILPGMSGLQTLVKLRQKPKLAIIPIFSVTGLISPDLKAAYLAADVTGFIEKPLTAKAVSEALENCGLAVSGHQRAA
jgi:two-component system, sensor histidine kinase